MNSVLDATTSTCRLSRFISTTGPKFGSSVYHIVIWRFFLGSGALPLAHRNPISLVRATKKSAGFMRLQDARLWLPKRTVLLMSR